MDWPIDFDHGMRFSSAYRQPLQHERWALLKERYRDFLAQSPGKNAIPKILHQIWLGSELPEQYHAFIEKLRVIHPQWEYKLWTDENIDFPLRNQTLFDRCENMGQKSDILRYEILDRFGGVYLDLDFIALKPFDALLPADFFAGVTFDRAPQLANGLIGCAPGSPLSAALCRLGEPPARCDNRDIMQTTGPDYFTAMVFDNWAEQTRGVVLPNTFFYPFPNFLQDRTLGDNYEDYTGTETFCCHLWHCSWLKINNSPTKFLANLKKLLHV